MLQERYRDETPVNMYECIEKLSEILPESAHVVSDAGSAYYVTSQALEWGQKTDIMRLVHKPMGLLLPQASPLLPSCKRRGHYWRRFISNEHQELRFLHIINPMKIFS